MIIGLQIIAILFALFMIYFAQIHFRRKEIGKIEFISWLIIWMVTIFVVAVPETLRAFAKNFAVTRLFDLMVVGGFILVIFLAASSYLGVRKLERKFEDLIRKEALKKLKKNKK